jgi:hypothetical protein
MLCAELANLRAIQRMSGSRFFVYRRSLSNFEVPGSAPAAPALTAVEKRYWHFADKRVVLSDIRFRQ